MGRVSVTCFLASYAVALLLEGLSAVRRGPGPWARLGSLGLTIAGFVAHSLYLYVRAQTTSLPPLLSSMQDWLFVLAWLLILVDVFVTLSDRQAAVGILVLPVVLALVIGAHFVSSSQAPISSVQRNWAMLHVGLLVFGMGGLLIGLVVSLMYLWQHSRLKSRHPGTPSFPFPNLERLHRWNKWLVMLSVPTLTLGMIIGVGLVVFRQGGDVDERVWSDPLVVMSLIAWVLMAAFYLWMNVAVRTPGRQVAALTVLSGGLLILTVLGAQVLARIGTSPSLHGPAKPPAGGVR